MIPIVISCLVLVLIIIFQNKRKIVVGVWSISIFDSNSIILNQPDKRKFQSPSLQASDVTDVPAEFIADPFIVSHQSILYMFFEILDKSSGRGIIGLAVSHDGEKWAYDKVILKENFHLSYPHVFMHNNEFYMIPETSEAKKVFLYKARNFPYDWVVVNEILEGSYVDSSIFQYNNKWWMFAAKSGKLHLFTTDTLENGWVEHPKSPLITNNKSIIRPGGRVIVEGSYIYRYTQDGEPTYGSSIRVFKITKLTESDYQEEEINIVLTGSKREKDWNKDGMHTIDQLKIGDNKWLIAVDGHKLKKINYLRWKLDRIWAKSTLIVKKK
jgi:mRNA-degrading endonuclease HigB of HigAB toxin-antitoxin module